MGMTGFRKPSKKKIVDKINLVIKQANRADPIGYYRLVAMLEEIKGILESGNG